MGWFWRLTAGKGWFYLSAAIAVLWFVVCMAMSALVGGQFWPAATMFTAVLYLVLIITLGAVWAAALAS